MADNNELVESANLLKAALDELSKSTTGLSSNTLKKLDDATKKLGKSTKDSADAIKEEIKQREKLSDAFRSMVKDLAQATTAVRSNRDDFNSLAPAVDAAATAAGFVAGALGRLTTSIGEAISGLSLIGGKVGWLIGTAVGGVVSSAGKMFKEHGKEGAQLMATMFKFSLGEIQRVSGAFQNLSSVGGLAGTGIQGLFESSQQLGLSMDQYAKLIGRNSQGLAFAAGSVAAGAKAVERITTAGTKFEEEFLKLGFSFEQQSEFAAKFLALNRISSRISLNDTKALSEASRKYLLHIDELARVTGKSRDSIAAKLEQEQRELRYGASLDLMTEDNRKAAQKLTQMLANISPNLAQMFKDSLGGLGTEAAQSFFQVTGGASEQLREQFFGKKTINIDQYLKAILAGAKEYAAALDSTRTESMVGGMGGPGDKFLRDQRLLISMTSDEIQNFKAVIKDQDKDRKNESENTKNLIKAQIGLRDLAKTLDKIVFDKLFPTMALQVSYFIEALGDGIKFMEDWLYGRKGGKPDPKGLGSSAEERAKREEAEKAANKAAAEARQHGATEEQRKAAWKALRDAEEARRRHESALKRERDEKGATGLQRPPSSLPPPPKKDPLSGLNFKGVAQATGGGPATPQLLEAARAVQQMYPGALFTAFDDFYHRIYHPGSAHTKGKAFDMVTSPPPRNAAEAADIKKSLQDTKLFTVVKDEYFADKNIHTRGGHFHAEVAAKGAIISGPSSGYRTAIETHGNEIIMPLKKDSPQLMVETKGMEEQLNLMSLQLRRLDNIIFLMQNSADTQTKIYQATVG